MNDYLDRIYHDPGEAASYGDADDLYRQAKKDGRNYTLKQIQEWLNEQEPYTLFRQTPHNIPSPKVIVPDKFWQYDMDTVNMTRWTKQNKGYSYFFLAIDIFTRYAFTAPLYTLTAKEMKEVLTHLFDKQPPKVARTDMGVEFHNGLVNGLMNERKIKHVLALNYTRKANYAERLVKTLKSRITKYKLHKQTHVWYDILDDVTHAYNNNYHRSIRMSPAQALKADKATLWWIQHGSSGKKLYSENKKKQKRKKKPKPQFKFKVGDTVRVVRYRQVFRRAYDEWNTHELFVITETTLEQGIPRYRLKTWDQEEVRGHFYTEELVRVKVTKDTKYKVEKVLFKKTVNGQKGFCVLWQGWPKRYTSWVSEEDLENLEDQK